VGAASCRDRKPTDPGNEIEAGDEDQQVASILRLEEK
jgi:hypothetical protein